MKVLSFFAGFPLHAKKKKMGRKFSTVVELQSVFLSAAADFNVSARALPLGARLSSFPVLPTPGKQKGGGGKCHLFSSGMFVCMYKSGL